MSALLLTLSACSAQTGGAAEAYKAELDDLVARSAGIEPAASILKDRVITEAEIAEVDKAFISCVENAGFPGATVDDLAGNVGIPMPADGSDSSAAFADCSQSTLFTDIHNVFWAMRTNPEHLTQDEAILACLKRFDVIDPNYTVEQFSREEDAWMESAPTIDGVIQGGPNEAHTYTDRAKGLELFRECESDPSITPDDE
ncbi:hypothetical protein [Schaalia hyovaginalis]|uniref:Uncharacterized protein n=1 Tax=Schaalia hyovaginalis TaxID=29316 RepID=A0A923E3V2_9ACTO|nr:hypothetical protein [Schaalia hyovaginalis]MBB6334383.1 hypothetical protein [Schaalia hyovaginalis]